MPPERVNPDRTDWQLRHVLKVGSRDGRDGVAPQGGHAHGTTRDPVSRPSESGWGFPNNVTSPSSAEVVAAHDVVVVVVGREVGNAGSHAAVVGVIWNEEKGIFLNIIFSYFLL
jgi:hypothetical protein